MLADNRPFCRYRETYLESRTLYLSVFLGFYLNLIYLKSVGAIWIPR